MSSSQYHASAILLHRPFALYEQSKSNSEQNSDLLLNTLSAVSRTVCVEQTLKMVRVLSVQLQRFEAIRAPQTQLQHIGTAVTALISAAAICRDIQERIRLLEALHILAEVARAIAPTYIPAEMISNVLENLLQEPGWNYKQMTKTEAEDAIKEIINNMTVIGDDFFRNPMAPIGMPQSQLSMSGFDRDTTFPFQNDIGADLLPRIDEADYSFNSRENLNSSLDSLGSSLPQQPTSYTEPDGMIDVSFILASS